MADASVQSMDYWMSRRVHQANSTIAAEDNIVSD